ncbi:M16 family metallopeptidase [Gulosibacter hominis]|uniref:M16 family metallopeptidase n=1 Tax=Gulosibacter hominis TaxID=2770504 RepID=UPI0019187F54|nr:pitrilysin family protein [Gulosibacter hominis]
MTTPIELSLTLPEIDAEVAGGARLRRTVLPNGLRLITEDVPGAASATVGFFVPLGSRDESAAEYGSSHFLEHLLFKGTPSRSARDVATEFERVGGDFNAATSREQTYYHARVRDHDLPMALTVLADMITSSLLDPAEFATERGVILEEIAMSDDDPIDVLWNAAWATYFGEHPLGRPIAGTVDSISAVNRDEVYDFYRRNYEPHRLVVAIAGRVDHDEALAILSAGLEAGGWPAATGKPPVDRRNGALVQPAGGFTHIDRALEQTNIVIAGPSIHATDERRNANAMLHHILGGGMASRLFQEVREKRGLAYSVHSFSAGHTDAGIGGVYVGCRPDRAAEAVDVAVAELQRIADEGVTETELADAVSSGAGAGALALESNVTRMHRLGRAETVLGEFADLDVAVARLEAVTRDEVQALAQDLVANLCTVSVIGPLTAAAGTRLEQAL